MTLVLRQLVLCNILYVCCVWWLVKTVVDSTCLQQRLLYLLRQGEHFPGVRVLFFLTTLLLRSVVCPMMSFRFLFLLYPYTGWLLNTVLRSSFICKRFQCFSITDLKSGSCLWKVVTNGIWSILSLVWYVRRSSRCLPPVSYTHLTLPTICSV